MRPVLFVNNLNAGGMERVCITLCNQWHREGRPFRLICLYAGGLLREQLHPAIHVEVWRCRNRNALPRLWRLIRQEDPRNPFLVFHTEIAPLFGLLKLLRMCPNPVVYREPSAAHSISTFLGRVLYRGFISRLDGFVAQTEATAADLRKVTGTPCHIELIGNPCGFVMGAEQRAVRLPDAAAGRMEFLAVGRMSPEKGYDRLLPAFAAILRRYPSARLRIAGDGPLKSRIVRQIQDLQLQASVELLGHVRHPEALYEQSDVLILASYFEGLPNVVIEALALGCPVLAAAGRGGTVEFLTRIGLADFLVHGDFVSALPNALESLCRSDPAVWAKARSSMVQAVHPQTIAARFWQVLETCCPSRPAPTV